MTSLPERFHGAWLRSELIVDGATVENGRTVWVEAGSAYVDVRGPGGFASDITFAGTTAWDEPYLSWAHEIDSEAGGDADRGLITVDGDDLIETGDYTDDGRTITFAERWSPLPGADAPVVAASTAGGMAVRVGDHASVIVDLRPTGGTIAARYQRWDGTSWLTEITYGDGDAVADLPLPLDPGSPLPSGWTWR